MNKKILLIALLAGSSLAVGSAGASLIAIDNFDYANGNLAGNDGGSGWLSDWVNQQGTAQVSGGMAVIDSTVGQQVFRFLDAPQLKANGGEVWIAFDAQMFTTGSGTTNTYGGFGLYNGGAETVLIGKGWPGEYVWIAGKSLDTFASTQSTLDFSSVYARITFDNLGGDDLLEVWINPSNPMILDTLPTDIALALPNLSFDSIRLRGGVSGGLTESWNFDNVRLGTTLADVAVPEPSVTALGLLAFAVGVAWHSRRRRLLRD